MIRDKATVEESIYAEATHKDPAQKVDSFQSFQSGKKPSAVAKMCTPGEGQRIEDISAAIKIQYDRTDALDEYSTEQKETAPGSAVTVYNEGQNGARHPL